MQVAQGLLCCCFCRYYLKKDAHDVYLQSKKDYCERRGGVWVLPNKRPHKLKDKLREFDVSCSRVNINNAVVLICLL